MANDMNIGDTEKHDKIAGQDECADNGKGGRHLRPGRTVSPAKQGDVKVTEKKFSKYLVSRILYAVILLVLLFIFGGISSGGDHKNHATNSEDSAFPIDSIDVQIDLNEDGSAQVTETWLMDYAESRLKSASISPYFYDYKEFCTAELEGLHVSENGNELQFDDDPTTALAPGYFAFREEEPVHDENWYCINFRPSCDGQKEMVLQYHLKNYVTLLEGNKAVLEYLHRDSSWDWQAQNVSVCISMDGRDLSANSLYDGAAGFHGCAGFDGPDYRIKTFNELQGHSGIIIHLALSPELFESLDSFHGSLYDNNLVVVDRNNAADQKLISMDFYRLCVIAAIVAALLAVALLVIVTIHLRRVYYTGRGDDLVLAESGRRHWIRYMSSSLVLSIVLIGLVLLVANIVPSPSKYLGSVMFAFFFCSLFIFNSMLMIDGLTTLRSLRKLKEKRQQEQVPEPEQEQVPLK